MVSVNVPRRAATLPPQGGLAPKVFEPSNTLRTHEGAPAAEITVEQQLRRSVCSCLLWENEAYEDGQEIGARIAELAAQVSPKVLADLAYDARTHFNLRHVPLLLCSVLARTGSGSRIVSDTIAETIQRADELAEFLAVYAKVNGVAPSAVRKKMSAQVKKGLARAFAKFDAYAMAKYDRDKPIRMRDVAFLSHVKGDLSVAKLVNKSYFPNYTRSSGFPIAETYNVDAFVEPKLETADTWEAALSAGADKRETFERLLRAGTLGYLALLRNLRNMVEAGVDETMITSAILARKGARRVLPFRYVAAARALNVSTWNRDLQATAQNLTDALDRALIASLADMKPLSGRTVVFVDVSGSMNAQLSSRSDLTRMDAAATLASVIPGDVHVYTFSDNVVDVGEPRGLSGIHSIVGSQSHGGTRLGEAISFINGESVYFPASTQYMPSLFGIGRVPMVAPKAPMEHAAPHDRLIVVTDEQSHSRVPEPKAPLAYMINVASAKHGVGYGKWCHIDGFSEQVIRFISEFEAVH